MKEKVELIARSMNKKQLFRNKYFYLTTFPLLLAIVSLTSIFFLVKPQARVLKTLKKNDRAYNIEVGEERVLHLLTFYTGDAARNIPVLLDDNSSQDLVLQEYYNELRDIPRRKYGLSVDVDTLLSSVARDQSFQTVGRTLLRQTVGLIFN